MSSVDDRIGITRALETETDSSHDCSRESQPAHLANEPPIEGVAVNVLVFASNAEVLLYARDMKYI